MNADPWHGRLPTMEATSAILSIIIVVERVWTRLHVSYNWIIHWRTRKSIAFDHGDNWRRENIRDEQGRGNKKGPQPTISAVPPQCLHRRHGATFPSVPGRNITVSPRAAEWYRWVIYRFICFIATRTRPYSGCTCLCRYLSRVRWDPWIYRTPTNYDNTFKAETKAGLSPCLNIATK